MRAGGHEAGWEPLAARLLGAVRGCASSSGRFLERREHAEELRLFAKRSEDGESSRSAVINRGWLI